MRTKSLILILIALGCGLVASIGISQVMEAGKGEAGPGIEMAPILVAMTDMDIGTKLDPKNVKLEEWPKAKIPEGALQSLDKLEDRFARARLYKGEAILEFKLMGPNEGRDTAIKIPRGMRAIPVRLELDTVIGLIQPGDKVDVMVFVRKTNEIKQTAMVTILTDVTVFAVGADVERTTDKDGKQVEAKTVSLLVKQEQAEKLAMATELGKIRLTLRRPDEEGDSATNRETTIEAMLGGGEAAATHDAPKTPVADIMNALGQQAQDPPSTSTPSAPAFGPPPTSGPKIQMMIMSPNDVKKFEWLDRNELPTEVAQPGLVTGGNTGFSGAPPLGAPPAAPPIRPLEENLGDN